MQWLRSFIYVILIYAAMAVLALYYTPRSLIDRRYAMIGCKSWCRLALWLARVMVGLRHEVRGDVPQEPCLIVSKHQSFLDIIILVSVLPEPRFLMKKSLLYAPILGWYAKAIGCVPVERGKGSEAMRQMLEGFQGVEGGQIIIYPQGTRVAPGVKRPYKQGAAVLYAALDRPAVPVAVNVGRFWPRIGIMRQPGLAVVEFLPPRPPGTPQADFQAEMEQTIEAASDRLDEEALAQLT